MTGGMDWYVMSLCNISSIAGVTNSGSWQRKVHGNIDRLLNRIEPSLYIVHLIPSGEILVYFTHIHILGGFKVSSPRSSPI